jgi:glutamine amidotransferase
MCRWAAYRGEPLYIEDIISSPCHSLIEQSHAASECKTSINGDGFGLAWYGERDEPGIYCDILPAWSDRNLRNIARLVKSGLFLAHVRASTGSPTSRQNCHPFSQGRWSFMHNGKIRSYDRIRRQLESMLGDDLYHSRRGSTDSELLFLLALQNGLELDPRAALAKTIGQVETIAIENGHDPLVRFTAALSDGKALYAIRYSTDAISPTLYMSGSLVDTGICVVSEPLDGDGANWNEISPNSFVEIVGDRIATVPFIAGKGTARQSHYVAA